ncbi:pro-FMRFamide-related neuropeptide FF isoform 1-T1 [Hipposideros larvatus]
MSPFSSTPSGDCALGVNTLVARVFIGFSHLRQWLLGLLQLDPESRILLLCDLNAEGLCPSSLLHVPVPQEEDTGPRPPQDAQTPGSLLRSLLQAMKRPDRSPAFLFQPQRFGRNTRGSWSNERLSPRAGEGLSSPFWSLAAPQRFGKK